MECGGPKMVQNGAEQEKPQNVTFKVVQENEEDVAETYEVRDGNEPPMENKVDNTTGQSDVIECDGKKNCQQCGQTATNQMSPTYSILVNVSNYSPTYLIGVWIHRSQDASHEQLLLRANATAPGRLGQ